MTKVQSKAEMHLSAACLRGLDAALYLVQLRLILFGARRNGIKTWIAQWKRKSRCLPRIGRL